MAFSSKKIHRSQTGDTWRPVRDTASDQILVRHEANLSSGGCATETSVEDFLRQAGSALSTPQPACFSRGQRKTPVVAWRWFDAISRTHDPVSRRFILLLTNIHVEVATAMARRPRSKILRRHA